MGRMIHLTDNNIEGSYIDDGVLDILKIANIGKLRDNPDLLIFPYSLAETNDSIGDLPILNTSHHNYDKDGKCLSLKVHTGNLMGFIGMNETSVSIHSRFTHKNKQGVADDEGKDFFLYYMLQKVLSINLLDLKHTTNKEDKALDFLLFLFPVLLKKALSQGLYKEYQHRYYDDAKVKGTVDISRFIRNDIPFKGRVSYKLREHCYDNSVTQLIRHTIEYIKQNPIGAEILRNDQETIDNVAQIVMVTPSYDWHNRERVLNENRKPKVHPYFQNYQMLQQLCIRILKHESLKYGRSEDKVYGILFDAAWLWEEYLNTILSKIGFTHPRNKEGKGGIRMFANPTDEDSFDSNGRRIYPDFYREDYILDAKYKHLNGRVGREDLYQVVSYMYCMDKPYGGYVYPDDSDQKATIFKLAGKGLEYKGDTGGILSVVPFKIPQKAENWKDFLQGINQSESRLKESFAPR